MKHILLDFYTNYNLGDDLFADILMEQFPDCKFDLLSGLRHVPKHMPSNAQIHPFSYVNTCIGLLHDRLFHGTALAKPLFSIQQRCRERLIRKADAHIWIGGSLFMDRGNPEEEIDFATEQRPVFEFRSTPQALGKSFLIGSNLGPVYHDAYWAEMRRKFSEYRHVCLRDYASYLKMRELPHVQYAPDVIFMVKQPEPVDIGENVVISVIDISSRTGDAAIIDAYYRLLKDTVLEFTGRRIPVTLTSFCKNEGDENGIDRLLSLLPSRELVSVFRYDGDIPKILSLLSNATFVVASRFHSMILGVAFGKPVFPISYNCKTRHYLHDLDFRGRYSTLEQLPQTTAADVLYNYENRIITDCSLHKTHSRNQFRALREFLGQDN